MSADLELTALPDTEEARALWAESLRPEILTHDDDPEQLALFDARGIRWMTYERFNEITMQIRSYPHLEVGQVSVMGEPELYMPAPIQRAWSLLGDDGAVLTPGLAKELVVAFNLPNRSVYGHLSYERVTNEEELERLRQWARLSRRRRRNHSRFIAPNIVQHGKGRGLIRPRELKKWLAEQPNGTRIVARLV